MVEREQRQLEEDEKERRRNWIDRGGLSPRTWVCRTTYPVTTIGVPPHGPHQSSTSSSSGLSPSPADSNRPSNSRAHCKSNTAAQTTISALESKVTFWKTPVKSQAPPPPPPVEPDPEPNELPASESFTQMVAERLVSARVENKVKVVETNLCTMAAKLESALAGLTAAADIRARYVS